MKADSKFFFDRFRRCGDRRLGLQSVFYFPRFGISTLNLEHGTLNN
jgi:hypothetical protein